MSFRVLADPSHLLPQSQVRSFRLVPRSDPVPTLSIQVGVVDESPAVPTLSPTDLTDLTPTSAIVAPPSSTNVTYIPEISFSAAAAEGATNPALTAGILLAVACVLVLLACSPLLLRVLSTLSCIPLRTHDLLCLPRRHRMYNDRPVVRGQGPTNDGGSAGHRRDQEPGPCTPGQNGDNDAESFCCPSATSIEHGAGMECQHGEEAPPSPPSPCPSTPEGALPFPARLDRNGAHQVEHIEL